MPIGWTQLHPLATKFDPSSFASMSQLDTKPLSAFCCYFYKIKYKLKKDQSLHTGFERRLDLKFSPPLKNPHLLQKAEQSSAFYNIPMESYG